MNHEDLVEANRKLGLTGELAVRVASVALSCMSYKPIVSTSAFTKALGEALRKIHVESSRDYEHIVRQGGAGISKQLAGVSFQVYTNTGSA